MNGRRWLAGLGLALILFLASACGSSSSNQATGTTPTSAGSAATTAPATTGETNPADADIEGTEINELPQVPMQPNPPAVEPAEGQQLAAFLRKTFDDIQSMWEQTFKEAGLTYVPASLNIFTGKVETACGTESSETGPFYCPADRTVYLDTSFFTLMEKQFGVTGDFAPAYVVAHEMGHHIQALLGVTTQVAFADQSDPAGMNGRSVRVELQADCLAGVWTHSVNSRGKLNDGDLDSALKAAAAVGDDFLQKLSGGETDPDSFTHGTSAQRQHWLTTGFESGDANSCDTFSAAI